MRRPKLNLAPGATVKMGGKTRRHDLTKLTLTPQEKVKAGRRKANRRAKASRKVNRGRH